MPHPMPHKSGWESGWESGFNGGLFSKLNDTKPQGFGKSAMTTD